MSPQHVREELDRVLTSKAFGDAERHRSFLRFVVEQTLDGRASEIKESVIGVEALGRNGSFDPKADPIVRVEAGRLRARLSSYYENEGKGDLIRIELPKGGYVPEFISLEAHPVIGARLGSRFTLALGAAAALLLVALATLSFFHFREQPPERLVVRFEISAPEKNVINRLFALSPDGHKLAMTLIAEGGETSLWIRELDSVEMRKLPGTEGASTAAPPFWSPDNRFVGFFADGKLKRIDVSGGSAQVVCDAAEGVGGAWSREGVIIFSRARSGIWRVPEAGGAATQITAVVPPEETYAPSLFPDGRHFLYEIGRTFEANRATFMATPDGKMKKRLLSGTMGTVYAPPSAAGEKGHLLYLRASSGGSTLMAQPFNEKSLDSLGVAFPVADNVGSFSASENGVLGYRALPSLFNRTQLAWFDRTGKLLGKVGPPGRYNGLALSPDGGRVALARLDDAGNPDIWILDVHRDVAARFTFDASTDWEPVWSPDGKRLAFASRRDHGIDQIYWKDSSGAGNEEAVWKSAQGQRPESWSPDGKFLLFMHQNEKGAGHNLWTLPVDPGRPGVERRAEPYFSAPSDITQGQFSPGSSNAPRWVAYTFSDSGQSQIYVQSFPAGAGKFQISMSGGVQPRWRRDGKELFYLSLERKLMAVEVKTVPTFEYGVPKELFQTPVFRAEGFPLVFAYDVAPDGNRFLVLGAADSGGANSSPVTVVLNWAAGLRR
jgi:eukaryotic-like serine/threonine-protein kinase